MCATEAKVDVEKKVPVTVVERKDQALVAALC